MKQGGYKRVVVVVSPRQRGKVLAMNKFGVTMALGRVHEARSKWNSAKRDFDEAVDKVMAVLLHEAARALMTQQEVAAASGLPVKRVRDLMRKHGLNPRDGKQMLSRQAAKALNENADLLGIKPQEMDLTSPLAYLPMGDEMRRQLADAQVKRVQEFPETATDEVNVECPSCGHEHWVTLA